MNVVCCRFEVEDVVDDVNQVSIALDPVSPSGVQQSITSLAYNTSEAVPNTMYYRNEENEGQSRPSLETLRLGQAPLPVFGGRKEVKRILFKKRQCILGITSTLPELLVGFVYLQ